MECFKALKIFIKSRKTREIYISRIQKSEYDFTKIMKINNNSYYFQI